MLPLSAAEPDPALAIPPLPTAATCYSLGIDHHRQGRWDEAIACYQQALALDPAYTAAHYNLGVVYDQRGQVEDAIDCYQRAIAHDPNYAKALSNLGCALAKQGQLDQAIQLYERATACHPTWATLHNNLGQVLVRQGKGAGAIASYQCAIALEPDMVLAYLNLAAVWRQQGHPQTALAVVQQALQRHPNHLAALDRCVSLALEVGKLPQALLALQRLVVQQSQWIAAYCCQRTIPAASGEPIASGKSHPPDHLTLSQRACGRLLQALQTSPLAAATADHLVTTLVYLGHALRTYGAYHQAETCYRRALQVQPQRAELYRYLGDILRQQRRETAAVLIYQAGRRLDANQADLALALAQSAEQQERWDVAVDYYRQVYQQMAQRQGQEIPLSCSGALLSEDVATPKPPSPPIQGIYIQTRDWSAVTPCPHTYRELDTAPPSLASQNAVPRAAIATDCSQPLRLSSCGGITCLDCTQRIMASFRPQAISPGLTRLEGLSAAPAPSPKFTLTLANGRAWITPQRNHWQVCHSIAILTPDDHLLGDLSRAYPWYLPGCDRYDFSQHHLLTTPACPPVETIDGTVAVLSGLSGHVYYHWMIDVLPRLDILQRCGIDLAAVDYVVVNSDRTPFQRATLAALGLPADRILTSDRHPHIQAKTLVVPSFPGALTWADGAAIAWLRHTFLPLASPDPDLPRQIYIQRTGASHRRVLNEAAVIEKVRRWGFVPVALETLSLAKQVSLFAQATAIVAPHGAGLTNLVFCRPETRLLELVSPHYVRPEYPAISQQLGLIHYQMLGEGLQGSLIRQLMYQSPVTEDLWINLEILQTALERMMGSAPKRAP